MEVADVKIHRANLEASIKGLVKDFELNSGTSVSELKIVRTLPIGERSSRVQAIICEVIL